MRKLKVQRLKVKSYNCVVTGFKSKAYAFFRPVCLDSVPVRRGHLGLLRLDFVDSSAFSFVKFWIQRLLN